MAIEAIDAIDAIDAVDAIDAIDAIEAIEAVVGVGCGEGFWVLFGGLGGLFDVDVLLGEWDFDVVVL